jgi:hypothetical protein
MIFVLVVQVKNTRNVVDSRYLNFILHIIKYYYHKKYMIKNIGSKELEDILVDE